MSSVYFKYYLNYDIVAMVSFCAKRTENFFLTNVRPTDTSYQDETDNFGKRKGVELEI